MAISLGVQAKKIPVHAGWADPEKPPITKIAAYFADLKAKGSMRSCTTEDMTRYV